MPTATVPHSTAQARNFALRGIAWGLGLFAVLRSGWFEAHAVLPLTQLQGQVATIGFGAPAAPIAITLACSGADVMALCAGAILAYPTRWRLRLAGAAAGIGLILILNTIRIGTLGLAATSRWFEVLHVHVWPALLVLVVAGYVFAWMRFADTAHSSVNVHQATRLTRFMALTGVFVVIFVAASPLYLDDGRVLAIATFIAGTAAAVLGFVGVQASAAANVLMTAHGGFLVTQECVTTPLIPVYLAAVLTYARTWPWRVAGVLVTAPLFVALGIVRLLLVALPAALVGSPVVLVHAFYQLLAAVMLVIAAAVWRHGAGAAAWRRAAFGLMVGCGLVLAFGRPLARLLTATAATAATVPDPQGALALLPAFQIGLYAALSFAAFSRVRWRPFAAGLAVLVVAQIATLTTLDAIVQFSGAVPHVRDVRAWALAAPLMLVAAMVTYDRPRR